MQKSHTVLEVEKKFICKNFDDFQKFISKQNFDEVEDVEESDDYFVDLNGEFLDKKICLRIRKTPGKAELTYKGASINHSDPCAKLEYSIDILHEHVSAISDVLGHLGYQIYVSVNKKRTLYKNIYSDLVYTIAIDYIDNVGYFVEFEILVLDSKKYDKKHVLSLLDKWLADYKNFDLEEVHLPYRDLVAKSLNIV